MMEEMCIVLDTEDNVIGEGTKKDVHLLDGVCMKDGGMPHRAFSVFLFNPKGELMLQKRSEKKILFPLHWANTCCSHPLAENATFEGTTVVGESEGALGTMRAARRKLLQELGIEPALLPLECFEFITRVHYKAPCPGTVFGEHEIDYLLVARPSTEILAAPNPNEVAEARYFSRAELAEMLAYSRSATPETSPAPELISPWFGEIEKEPLMLHRWWDAILTGRGDDVPGMADGKIHRLKGAEGF